MKTKYKNIALFAAIILAQLIFMLYWAGQKTNYYIDELYTIERAVTYAGRGNGSLYLVTTAEWTMDDWVQNSELKKYLIMSEEESLFNLPFMEAAKRILFDRPYNGLLSMVTTIMGYDVVTARPGIALNMMFLILTEIFLLLLMKRLEMSFESQCFALAMFGFSGYIIGFVEYVRFYTIVLWLLFVMFCLLHVLWNSSKLLQIIGAELGIFVCAYFLYEHTELTIACFGAVSACFVVAFIRNKEWKKVFSYCGILLAGAIYMLATTRYLDVILHPEQNSSDWQILRMVAKILSPSLGLVRYYIGYLPNLFLDYYFGSATILLLVVFAVSIYLLRQYTAEKSDSKFAKAASVSIRPVTVALLVLWMALFAVTVLANSGKVVCIILLFVVFAYMLWEMKILRLDLKQLKLGRQSKFVLLIAIAGLMYTIFAAMQDFSDGNSRYNFFNFTCAIIVFWFVIDRVTGRVKPDRIRRGLTVIMACGVVLMALTPFVTRNVDYIYEDDAEFKLHIEQHLSEDTVLYVLDNDGDISTHETYDCINMLSGDARIFATDLLTYNYEKVPHSDKFLLWTKAGYDLDRVLADYTSNGYNIEYLGKNHVSKAYFISK